MKIISQIHRTEYLNHHISISPSGDRTWSYTIHNLDWQQLGQETGLPTDTQALKVAKTNLEELLICP